MCMYCPVAAVNGTVTITYRGAGGNYIGDTIYFDGMNTVGNMTVLKITGPGLPVDGVPLYDANGTVGSGNTVATGLNNNWFFFWDTNRMKGNNLLQTARYTFTAFDLNHPEVSATTSIMLKRPEFYIVSSLNPAGPGDYVQLTGNAEKGVSYVKIDVTDTTGTVAHTFMSPVGANGDFQYGFHVDMPPGQYRIIVSNPSMKSGLNQTFTVAIPTTVQPVLTSPLNVTATTVMETTMSASTPTPTPTRVPLSVGVVITGCIGAIALFHVKRREHP
ncbi:MAG: hypothetical protein NTZ39_02985 [Methanoregula sp.]|nr:hypothetical protein [Methanoregula sp.]